MKRGFVCFTLFLLVGMAIFAAGCAKLKEAPSEEKSQETFDTGILDIKSVPPDARVYVDSELKGVTPLSLENFPAGTHDLLVKKERYADFGKSVTIKAGRKEEIEAVLVASAVQEPKAEEAAKTTQKKPEEKPAEALPASATGKIININKSFAMYYDFDNAEFTDIRSIGSDVFSRKYDNYVYFTALTPAKINLINKPISQIDAGDCIVSDTGVAPVFSGQTLCVKTEQGNVIAVGGIWQAEPAELEWIKFN